jgi:hypothetical protein
MGYLKYSSNHFVKKRAKPGASSPGAKQYEDGRTNQTTDQRTDEDSYRGAMLAPKNVHFPLKRTSETDDTKNTVIT